MKPTHERTPAREYTCDGPVDVYNTPRTDVFANLTREPWYQDCVWVAVTLLAGMGLMGYVLSPLADPVVAWLGW